MAIHPATLLKAAALIEEFEGIEEEAYLDPIGIPTICAGLTRYPNGTPVRMGDICSGSICRAHLENMLLKEYLPAMEKIPGWERLGASRQAVLMSFAWNLGANFYGSEGFETITKVLRDGASRPEIYQQMSYALGLYVKAGGRVFEGLVKRRKREAAIWNLEDDGTMIYVCTQDTFLKKAAILSSYLSELGRRSCEKGDEIAVSKTEEIPADSHMWVQLNGSGEKWAIYAPHWAEKSTLAAKSKAQKINWNDFSCRIGEYITVGEVLQYDARRKPKTGSKEAMEIQKICAEFDNLRKAWAGPIGITSGYRPEPYNSQVGGVRNSYHVQGMALDIYPIGESLEKFHQWLIRRWSGGYGDGRHRGFIHIDTRNGGGFSQRAEVKPAAVWTY